MRELVIQRIEEIKSQEGNFSKQTMKWKRLNVKGVHISELDFNTVYDEDLVPLFEAIISQYTKQY